MKRMSVTLAVFTAATGIFAETITVNPGETKTHNTFLVVDNPVAVHGDLTITGSKVWVSADENARAFNLGTWSNDRAKVTVTGGARIGPGAQTRNTVYFNLVVGSASNGTGWLDVYNTEGGGYTGWSTNSYNGIFNKITIVNGTPTNETGYIDFLRINGNANCIVGCKNGAENNASDTARIRFNGGKYGPYNGTTMLTRGNWVFESENDNEIWLHSWWGHTTMLGSTARLTFQGGGGVTLSGNKEAKSDGYYYTLSTNITWNQAGDVKFTTEMGAKLADDYALSKIHRDGKRVLFSNANAQINLNGHHETLNGFRVSDFTSASKTVKLCDTATTKGRFEIGNDDPAFQLDPALCNCFVLEPNCLPILKIGASPMTLVDGYSAADFPLEWSNGRLTVSNGYHWIRFKGTASVQNYPEGVRDLSAAFVDNLPLDGGELVVRRGALVSTNLSLSANVAVHVHTNSAIRMQAKGVRTEKFVRFVFKEARDPRYWIHIRTLRLLAADNTEQFFNKGYARNATAGAARDLKAGEYMFNPGTKWIEGLAMSPLNGVVCNQYYECDDVRFSKTDTWGGLCLTNSIPNRREESTWNVVTIRLKDDAKPIQGYVIDTNWTFEYFPYCWEVLVSADGESWTSVDEKTNYVPYAYSSHNADTDELGGTYEGYRTFNDAIVKPHRAFHWTRDVDPALVHLALNGAKVRIDRGGILDATLTDGSSEVSSLEVDASLGFGTFKNITFAENGTINVLTPGILKSKTRLSITLVGCADAANLANWKVSVNGIPDGAASVATADGELVISVSRGTVLILR